MRPPRQILCQYDAFGFIPKEEGLATNERQMPAPVAGMAFGAHWFMKERSTATVHGHHRWLLFFYFWLMQISSSHLHAHRPAMGRHPE